MSRPLTKAQVITRRKALGAVLRTMRKRNKEIQASMSTRAGVSLPTVILMERGTTDFHVDSLIKLCHAHGVDLAKLIEAQVE